jgi:two-component system, NarL family, nitrate/nitrite response regulator NarL
MEQREIRIVILQPSQLVRECLVFFLAQQKAISVVCAAPRFDRIDGHLTAFQSNLFLVDFGGPSRSGLEDAEQILAVSSEFRILMTGVPDSEADVLACIERGAAGYLLEDASTENLIDNIRALAVGETLCSPRIASIAFSRISSLARQTAPQHRNLAGLTRRELEIIALIENGLSNKEIATNLHIEVQTVKNHVHNILEKLNLHKRREAALYARQRRLAIG